jgi:glycosyltransferase involved in cell wall biosynthesis
MTVKTSKVLHLRSSGGMLGAERVIIELCKNSHSFGFESHVGVIHNTQDRIPEFYSFLCKEGIPCFLVEDTKNFSITRVGQIKTYCQTHSIEILHTHGYKEDLHAVFCGKLHKIATNHLWKRTDWKSHLYAWLDLLSLFLFNKVVGVSDEIVNEMKRKGLQKAFKIPNGIDLSLFKKNFNKTDIKKQLFINENQIVIGMISSLTPEKNHELALNAFRKISEKYPNTTLLIVGDGWMRTQIEAIIHDSNLNNRVKMLGSRSDIPELLSVIDLFLLPSKKEGLPMSLLEAMASGKAIVASSVGEIPNVIRNNTDGILIDCNSVEQLQNALEFMLNDTANLEKFGKSALERSMEFSARTMTESYCKIYEKVLKKC